MKPHSITTSEHFLNQSLPIDSSDEAKVKIDDRLPDKFENHEAPDYFEVWAGDGPWLARSPSLGDAQLSRIDGPVDHPVFREVTLPDGRRGRLLGLTFHPHAEEAEVDDEPEEESEGTTEELTVELVPSATDGELPAVSLVVATGTAEINAVLTQIASTISVESLAGILLTTFVQTWIVRHGFAPLENVASRIEQVDEHALSSHITMNDTPNEMRPIVNKLNELLERLETAFQRERSFSSDVAHELRTPLAGILSTLELGISRERTNSEYRDFLQRTIDVCQEMRQTVECLLSLTRIDAGQVTVTPEELSLDDILTESWRPFSNVAETRNLEIRWDLQNGRPVTTDKKHLKLILRNVFSNAVHHANEQGQIRIATALERDAVHFREGEGGHPTKRHAQDQPSFP